MLRYVMPVNFRNRHSSGQGWQQLLARQFVICCALFLALGQFAAVSHAHETDHEKPKHQSCYVCVLALSEDIDDSDVIELDQNDTVHFTTNLNNSGLRLIIETAAPRFELSDNGLGPPLPPILRRNAPRAPPFHT